MGNLAGQALQSVAVGVAGAAAGAAAGTPAAGVGAIPGAAAGAVGGLVARGAAKKMLVGQVEKLIAEQLAKGATREAAEAAGKKLAADQLRKTGGGVLAAGALNVGKETGSIYADRAEDAQAAGEDLTTGDAARAIAAGTVAGLVDTAAEGLNVGRLLKGASPNASMARRVAAGVAGGAATEGGTEVVQTALERAGAGRSLADEEALSQYLEAGAGGAIGGGVLSGAAGVRRSESSPAAQENLASDQSGEQTFTELAAGATSIGKETGSIYADGNPVPDPSAGPISRSVNNGIDASAIPTATPFPAASPGSLADAGDTLTASAMQPTDMQETGNAPPAGVVTTPVTTGDPLKRETPAGSFSNPEPMPHESTSNPAGVEQFPEWNRETLTDPSARAIASQAPAPAMVTGDVGRMPQNAVGERPAAAPSTLAEATHRAATSPHNNLPDATPAQREAGNFKVGRWRFAGREISIEYPAGVQRKPDHVPLTRAYGYFRGSKGKDGEHVDVFIGQHADDSSLPVFVVDQVDRNGKYDEAKVVLGEANEAAARAAYLSNYPDDWNGLGAITRMTQGEFKAWLVDPKKTRQPLGTLPPASSTDKVSTEVSTRNPQKSDAPPAGLSLDRAHRLTQRLTRGWGTDAPRVVLVRNADELQQAAGLPAGTQAGERTEGTYQGKRAVFLNIGAIESPQRFRQVLAHEALGHYGMERVVGKAEWKAIGDAIGRHVRDGTGGKEVREAIDHLRRSQPEALQSPDRAAREVLAVMAERGNRNGLIMRAVSGARRFLRRHMPDLKWNDADVRDLLNQADGVLRRGAEKSPFESTAIDAGQPTDDPLAASVGALVDAYRHTDETTQGALFSKSADPSLTTSPDVSNVARDFDHLDDTQRAALGKIDTFRPRATLADRLRTHGERWQAKFVQGVFDQFAPLKDLDETAYMQARLSKGTDGAVEAAFRHGPPKLTEGALDVVADGKGLQGHLQELGGEHDLFLAWLAGNRAEGLKAEGREHLFDDGEIAALKQLGTGKMADGRARAPVYAAARRTFNRYQKHVLDIAEEAGILDPEARKLWTHDFYIPFYRVMEGEKAVSPGAAVTGLVRQKAFERLKGGTEPLGDLLANTLSNWSHLLSASMKNMSARRALEAAADMGIATPATGSDKGTVWVTVAGRQQHYTVSDPLVFDALTMLHHPGWNNPAMKGMQWFKRALTAGVTADPAFRIRNLIRDTVSSIAANRVGYNPLRNLVEGWKATERGGDTYLRLLGGGGAVRFGTLLDGDQAGNAKRLIKAGIATEGQILDTPTKAKAVFTRAWDRWQELGDRAETVNRAVAYQQARAEGKTHLEASYAARDLLDFTMGGKWAAVRFLTQVVPFMNARLQGIYKLGRAAKEDPRRFATVTGAVAMSSVLLHLFNADDEEYQALPDWVRDTYWWVKLPGTEHALYIPKPFEIGALGSVAERATELMTGGEDYRAADFGRTLLGILNDQLSMNPVPQAFRPAMEAAFNRNTFQERPIDGMGQEQLPAADRYTARTSAGAVAAGKALNVSPQRIEHMVRGYFGWLGSQALAASDLAGRSLFDMPANPANDFTRPQNLIVVGAFVRPTQGSGSKYVNRYYAQQQEVNQIYAAYSAARKAGDIERAAELYKDDRLRLRALYRAADRQMRGVNQQVRRVTSDRTLTATQKAELLEGLYATRNRVAKWTTEEARREKP
ncbi:MAG: hypothetical protein QM599_03420 [Pseudoxanthomonas sp.]